MNYFLTTVAEAMKEEDGEGLLRICYKMKSPKKRWNKVFVKSLVVNRLIDGVEEFVIHLIMSPFLRVKKIKFTS